MVQGVGAWTGSERIKAAGMEFPVSVFFTKQKQSGAGTLLSVCLGVEKKAYRWTFFQQHLQSPYQSSVLYIFHFIV